ncbi:hypothetical protein BDZ85DRAFT_271645 [Elsinoe ampelina]|uniref:Major facilitator superfamily domain-containing protein n=1 Tax=Elsinoe ampelina TaxID=302913 RepID=A0A6A6GKX3_9PEZI|nr:hypothetical protein BDZ85DRAFT_271645 [Elsinoe ampelina]
MRRGCAPGILSSGMGAIFPVIVHDYPGQELKANDLMTYHTLFMSSGNVIIVPFALGRPSLTSHIAGRNIMSLAAGQSGALSLLMIHEIHFLHERSKKLSWFIFVQNVSVVLVFFFAAETSFDRPIADMTGQSAADDGKHTKVIIASHRQAMTGTSGSIWDGLSIIPRNPQWRRIPSFYLGVLKGFCINPVIWAFLLNGVWLGLYVFQAATLAPILMKPLDLFSFTNLAFVQGSQIIVSLIFLQLLGYGGDFLAKHLAKRNNSMYKPEYRLLPLAIPCIIGIITMIIYGRAAVAQDLSTWNWASVAVTYNAGFFAFLGANIVVLVIICAGRGLESFALRYVTLPAMRSIVYDGAPYMFAGLCGFFTLLVIPVYVIGPRTRAWAMNKFGTEASDDHRTRSAA